MTAAPSSRWAPWLQPWTLDLRSLALFRVWLGGLLLLSSLGALGQIGSFYSDGGVLPRATLTAHQHPWSASLHLVNGESSFAAALILLQALAALALLLGWRARGAALLGWLLSVSLSARNPLVATTGDALMHALLLWSAFLPVAARGSVDAAREALPQTERRHLSWASAGLVCSVLIVSLFAAAGMPGWDGASETLSRQPAIGGGLSPLLLAASLLLLVPMWNMVTRSLGLVLLALWQIATLMLARDELGIGPWALLCALSALLPGTLWERRSARSAADLRIYLPDHSPRIERAARLLCELLALPSVEIAAASSLARTRRLAEANQSWVVLDRQDSAHLAWAAVPVLVRQSPWLFWLAPALSTATIAEHGERYYRWLARPSLGRRAAPSAAAPAAGPMAMRVAAALLVLMLAGALLAAARDPARAAAPAAWVALGLAPPSGQPPALRGWFAAVGSHADGSEVDTLGLRPTAPDLTRPPSLPRDTGIRWALWQAFMAQDAYTDYRDDWASYLCRRWNAGMVSTDPARIEHLRLIYLAPSLQAGGSGFEQRILLRQDCPRD